MRTIGVDFTADISIVWDWYQELERLILFSSLTVVLAITVSYFILSFAILRLQSLISSLNNHEKLLTVEAISDLSPLVLRKLACKMVTVGVLKGDYVVRKGEISRDLYIVEKGVVNVLNLSGDVVARMRSGDLFGESEFNHVKQNGT